MNNKNNQMHGNERAAKGTVKIKATPIEHLGKYFDQKSLDLLKTKIITVCFSLQ